MLSSFLLDRVNAAILEAFGVDKFDFVRDKFDNFIDSIKPVAEFADFENSSIRGAYLISI